MIRFIGGDCRERLKDLPDRSVQCVVTSPPYFGLRDYQVVGQIGLEASPAAYVAEMVAVFREVWRVLRDDGTVWLNLGDSYATRWSSARSEGRAGFDDSGRERHGPAPDGFKSKDLMMIPARVAIALQDDGWYLRKDIIWAKPNPMPESVNDRPTSSHEHVFLLTKRQRYFYDAEAVREQSITNDPRRPYGSEGAWQLDGRPVEQRHGGKPRTAGNKTHKYVTEYEGSDSEERRTKAGLMKVADVPWSNRNLRDVWTIATQPYANAHFATFPPELVERCVKAGTSERGACPKCGAPWTRTITKGEPDEAHRAACGADASGGYNGQSTKNHDAAGVQTASDVKRRILDGMREKTYGWQPTCECPPADPVPCVVLDPFSGAGTTALVADRMGRDAIGIDLNPTYGVMARERLVKDAGMFAEFGA